MDRGSLLEFGEPYDLLKKDEGTATVEIHLASPLRLDLSEIEGVLESTPIDQGWRLKVISRGDGSPSSLPALVNKIVLAGGTIRRVEVRWPDLGDLLPERGV